MNIGEVQYDKIQCGETKCYLFAIPKEILHLIIFGCGTVNSYANIIQTCRQFYNELYLKNISGIEDFEQKEKDRTYECVISSIGRYVNIMKSSYLLTKLIGKYGYINFIRNTNKPKISLRGLLCFAIMNGFMETMEIYLHTKDISKYIFDNILTYIYVAISYGNYDIAFKLINECNKHDNIDIEGYIENIIVSIVMRGDIPLFYKIYQKVFRTSDIQEKHIIYTLKIASMYGKVEFVKLLLTKYQISTTHIYNAILLATEADKLNVIKLIMVDYKKFELNLKETINTIIFTSAKHNCYFTLKYILSESDFSNKLDLFDRYTLYKSLKKAVYLGNNKMVKLLLQHERTMVSYGNNDVLRISINKGHNKIFKMLLGSDSLAISIEEYDSLTKVCINKGNIEMENILAKHYLYNTGKLNIFTYTFY